MFHRRKTKNNSGIDFALRTKYILKTAPEDTRGIRLKYKTILKGISIMEMITTQDLCKTFRNTKNVVEAVKNVNLHIKQGEIFGFLGPNGAGKTTTMRMLTTLMPPTSGIATIVGKDLMKGASKIRRKIGYVSQKGGTYEHATGYENLVLQGRLYGLSEKVSRKNAEDIIKAFRMEEYCNRRVATYSGGQRRHIDLGLGVMHNPELLFLDEPTTGLDPASRANFWEKIKDLRATGITVFLTTHYLDEADNLCDTICIMDHGMVVAEGTALELKRQISGDIIEIGIDTALFEKAKAMLSGRTDIYELSMERDKLKMYVEAGDKALPEILAGFAREELPVRTIEMSRPSLDEVFLKKTGHSIQNGEKEIQ
jgi:ABC-2 type transport system ATP-binding protein